MAKGKKAKGNGKKGKGRMPTNPPEYQAITTCRRKFRFQAAVAWASGTLSQAQLLSMPGTMCTVTNATVVSTAVSVKLHRVSIWGIAPTSGSAPSTVDLRFVGGQSQAVNQNAVMKLWSDSSVNPMDSPKVTAVPPAGSQASFWQTADNLGTDTLLCINCPQYSIIEFDLEFNIGMPPAFGSFSVAVGTGTVGVMYWLSLLAQSGTGLLIPISLATTI